MAKRSAHTNQEGRLQSTTAICPLIQPCRLRAICRTAHTCKCTRSCSENTGLHWPSKIEIPTTWKRYLISCLVFYICKLSASQGTPEPEQPEPSTSFENLSLPEFCCWAPMAPEFIEDATIDVNEGHLVLPLKHNTQSSVSYKSRNIITFKPQTLWKKNKNISCRIYLLQEDASSGNFQVGAISWGKSA